MIVFALLQLLQFLYGQPIKYFIDPKGISIIIKLIKYIYSNQYFTIISRYF